MGEQTVEDRLPDGERSVAGAILIDGRAYAEAAKLVSAEDFCDPACASVFRAAAALTAEGNPVDPVLIDTWLREHGMPVSRQWLAGLMEVTPTAANVGYYAGIVRESAGRRRAKALARQVLDTEGSASTLIAQLSDGAQALLNRENTGMLLSSNEMMHRFYDDLAARHRGSSNVVATGLRPLDDISGGGLVRGGLYILAGRPGMGKTTLALNIADNIQGGVLLVSLEMTENQLSAKRLARAAGFSAKTLLLAPRLLEEEFIQLNPAASALSESGVYMNRSMDLTVPDIGLLARSVPDLRLVVIDYLGLIRAEGKLTSRYEAVTQISGSLKRLALTLNVPILCLSQLNRAAEGRDDRRPRLSDLRDSGAVEQDADGVMLLYRPDYYEPGQSRGLSELELEFAKNRHGATGRVKLFCDLSTASVHENRKEISA